MTATGKALRIGETKVVKPYARHKTFPEGPFELRFSRRLTEQVLNGEEVCPGFLLDLKTLKI